MNIVRQIQELADRERSAAASVDTGVLQTPTAEDPVRELARRLFLARPDGEPYPIEAWGTWPEHVGLPAALTNGYPLIVDLCPLPRAEFEKKYLHTPEQMAQRAADGKILVNLYEYDSDAATGFQRHMTNAEVIRPFLEDPGVSCRINSIRRERLFTLMGDGMREAAREEGQRIFEPVVKRLEPTALNRLMSTGDKKGALKRLSENWAYMSIFGTGNVRVEAWMDRVRTEMYWDPDRMGTTIRELSAYKTLLATPYTAAFGSVPNIRKSALSALVKTFAELETVIDAASMRKRLSSERGTEINKLLQAVFAGRQCRAVHQQGSQRRTNPLSDTEFERSREALDAIEEPSGQLMASRARSPGTSDDEVIERQHRDIEIQDRMHHMLQKFTSPGGGGHANVECVSMSTGYVSMDNFCAIFGVAPEMVLLLNHSGSECASILRPILARTNFGIMVAANDLDGRG